MQKIEYNIFVRDTRNASSKAKEDVSRILFKLGYCKLYKPSKSRLVRIIQQFFSILVLPNESELFIQYHSNISFFYYMLRFKKKVNKIAIIHDLESLRNVLPLNKEVKILNGFDRIISHNSKMTKYLKDNGVVKPIYNLQIFDYLLNKDIKIKREYDKNTIFFAGNLIKSNFLSKLSDIDNVNFNIFGVDFDGLDDIVKQKNVSYKGAFSPEDLIANIEGGWGLVWDGDSLNTCSGITGNYLKYNNPHKVSMCIVSERPVIVWDKSAMSEYINSKHIGITVSSLYELSDKLSKISSDYYELLLNNVKSEKELLINGQILSSIIKNIDNNNVSR